MLTMHIWLLHKRLIMDHLDETTALLVQEEMFNCLWDDTMCRIRGLDGVMELSVNNLLMKVQQYTFLHLTTYDHIYTTPELLTDPALRIAQALVDACVCT